MELAAGAVTVRSARPETIAFFARLAAGAPSPEAASASAAGLLDLAAACAAAGAAAPPEAGAPGDEASPDWTGGVRRALMRLPPGFVAAVRDVVEVGCFHGRTTNLLCDVFRDQSPAFRAVTCIDPWDDGFEEPGNPSANHLWRGQLERFTRNTERNAPWIRAIRASSHAALPVLARAPDPPQYDLAYVDGDHTAMGVYLDAVLLLPLMRRGGYILFDDYLWGEGRVDPALAPKLGIDRFLEEHRERVRVVHQDYQLLAHVLP
jgi:hypothetical protein